MGRFRILVAWCLLFGCGACTSIDASNTTPDEAYQKASEPNRRAIERVRYADIAIDSGTLTREELADVHYWRGESYYYLRNYERAIRDYDEVLRILPNDALAYGARGHANYVQGRFDDAIEDYRRAFELSGDRTWRDAIGTAQRDREEARRAERRPPPMPAQDTMVDLVYLGMYAAKIQKDSVFDPANEVDFHCQVFEEGRRVGGGEQLQLRVKQGTRAVYNKVVWTGSIHSQLTLTMRATEVDFGGKIDGHAEQAIGHSTVRLVPAANLSRPWLTANGFHHHVATTMTGGKSRFIFYFAFRRAR